MDATEKVLEVMRSEGQPLNAGKVAEIGNLDRKDVDKAMAKLKKEGKITNLSFVVNDVKRSNLGYGGRYGYGYGKARGKWWSFNGGTA